MGRILKISLMSAVIGFMVAGCSVKSTGTTPTHTLSGYEIPVNSSVNKKKLHDKVMKIGESNGWMMTEYSDNSILAEQISSDGDVSATISFNENNIVIKNNSSSKYDAYIDELGNKISNELK